MMMKVLLSLLFSLCMGAVDASSTSTTTCSSRDHVDRQFQRFHSNESCHRGQFNEYKLSLQRWRKHRELQETGTYSQVPNQLSVVCPTVVQDLRTPITGYDTTWVVENTASTPVVLIHVTPEGVEQSATGSKVPPLQDAGSILQPGESKVIHTHEGHEFRVREVLKDGGGMGNVLLQHRAGLIPVGLHSRNLVCPAVDEQPVLDDDQEDPAFARTPPLKDAQECNRMDVGFRNMAGCPLHAYYQTPGSCDESFKFHLGIQQHPLDDFTWQWQSPTKFESTMMGHAFVFRSAFSAQIVEIVRLEPTRIVDCPSLQNQVQVSVGGLDVSIPTATNASLYDGVMAGSNSNNATMLLYSMPSMMNTF